MIIYRDLIGATRTPARFVVAALALTGFGLLSAVAWVAPISVMAAVVGVAAIIGYLGLGVWSDGIRHAIDAAGGPQLYGIRPTGLVALHALLPTAAGLFFACTGAAIAVALGGPWFGALFAMLGTLFTVTVRVLDATKGQMPLRLLTPIPTPAGDLSGILIAYWQADSLVMTLAVLAGVALLAASNPVVLVALVPAGLFVLLLARRRLARR